MRPGNRKAGVVDGHATTQHDPKTRDPRAVWRADPQLRQSAEPRRPPSPHIQRSDPVVRKGGQVPNQADGRIEVANIAVRDVPASSTAVEVQSRAPSARPW
jgi:hypothetical protein